MPSDEYRPGKELVKILKNLKEYIDIRYDIFKLEITETLAKLISGFYIFFILVSMITTAALFFSFAAAYYLGEILESLPIGFMLVGFFYILLIFVFIALRNKLITRPIISLLSRLFFNDKKD